jgi:hypothetical protein
VHVDVEMTPLRRDAVPAADTESPERPRGDRGDDGRTRSEGTDALILQGLAAGMSQSETGRHAGVSPRTVRRRVADPDFRAQVARARDDYVDRVAGQLMTSTEEAVSVLRRLMQSDQQPALQLRAALAVLQTSAQWGAIADMQARLSDLESSET